MKIFVWLALVSLTVPCLAQNARVIPLSTEDRMEAFDIHAQESLLEDRKKAFKEHIQNTYLVEPEKKDSLFGLFSIGGYQSYTPACQSAPKGFWWKSGWCGPFEYTDDFAYIVPAVQKPTPQTVCPAIQFTPVY